MDTKSGPLPDDPRPVAWALAALYLAIGAVFAASRLTVGQALAIGGGAAGSRSAVGDDVVLLALYLSVLGPPVVVSGAVGVRARVWVTLLACQAVGVASAVVVFLFNPDLVGLAMAGVAAANWATAGVLGGALCAARWWWAGAPLRRTDSDD